jgi:hypothetical protein
MVMASYTMTSTWSPSEVVNRARVFFGRGGLDLNVCVSSERCVRFADGGYVQVSVRDGGNETIVDLETRLWDEQVRDFMTTLTGRPERQDTGS